MGKTCLPLTEQPRNDLTDRVLKSNQTAYGEGGAISGCGPQAVSCPECEKSACR